jgi:hypothetical protein
VSQAELGGMHAFVCRCHGIRNSSPVSHGIKSEADGE